MFVCGVCLKGSNGPKVSKGCKGLKGLSGSKDLPGSTMVYRGLKGSNDLRVKESQQSKGSKKVQRV